tara:strand:- start:820 stop:1005 length:186 start_codon:yes stop_codon:yes gene_type:complete
MVVHKPTYALLRRCAGFDGIKERKKQKIMRKKDVRVRNKFQQNALRIKKDLKSKKLKFLYG